MRMTKTYRVWCAVLVGLVLAGCGAQPTVQDMPLPAVQTSGFAPQRDGFGFENYGAGDVTNLTAADLQRMFGDEVCASVTPRCTLIAPARIWMEALNSAMETGHCEGMAVLSQYFYHGVLKPDAFGSKTAAQLVLAGNVPLQREIAYWWATQATYPTRAHHHVLDANAAIAMLRAGLHPDAPVEVLHTMGVYEANGRGGHTVTPIGLRTIDEGHVAIEIYDNNVPNTTQEIVVDTVQNSWSYQRTRDDGSVVRYAGDATSGTLDLTETSPRLEQQVCQFCPGNPLRKGIEELTTILFSSALPDAGGDAQAYSAYFEDAQGRRSGIVLGTAYNEIPGVQVHYLRAAGGPWTPNGMPMLELPVATEGTVYVTGAADAPVTISAFGAGSVVSVQHLQVDATVASEVRLDQRRGTAAVASGVDSTLDIVVGYSDGIKNVETQVKRVRVRKGDTAAVATNRDTDQVAVYAQTEQQVDVQVTVGQRDDKGPPRERNERQPADAQELAPLQDGMQPGPVEDTTRPTRAPRGTPGADRPAQTGEPTGDGPRPTQGPDQRANGTTPLNATPNRDVAQPRPTRGPNDAGGPQPTRGPEGGGGPQPTRGPEGGGGPQPTRGPEGGGGPQPTRGPEGGGGAQPTRGPEGGGGPQPTRGSEGGGGPQPTRGPNDAGGPQPTRGAEGGGGPQPTRGPEGGGGPQPTRRP